MPVFLTKPLSQKIGSYYYVNGGGAERSPRGPKDVPKNNCSSQYHVPLELSNLFGG
jgi:hypothetical protein